MQLNRNVKDDRTIAATLEPDPETSRDTPLSAWIGLTWCGAVLAAYYAYNWEYYITKVGTFAAYLGL